MDTPSDAEAAAIPPAFHKAVAEFALLHGIEAEPIFEGNPIDHEGTLFWLRHFGDNDLNGLTLQMDIGEPPAEEHLAASMTTHLLNSHLTMPPNVFGYYGYLPDVNRLVHCTRIALDEVEDSTSAIAAAIEIRSQLLAGARAETARRFRARDEEAICI